MLRPFLCVAVLCGAGLLVASTLYGQELPGAKSAPAAAADDDFRPPPPRRSDDAGPRGPRDLDRAGAPPPPFDRSGGSRGPGAFDPPPDRPGNGRGPGGFNPPPPPDGSRGSEPPGGRRPGGHGGPDMLRPPRGPHPDWESLEQNDPEMHKLLRAEFDLDQQSQELAMQYRRAPKDQQEELKKKLAEAVAAHFKVRQERRLLEVKRLEEEVKRLRESIDLRNTAKEKIVTRRVSELLGLQDDTQF